jgi:predicted PurR-regulated permease PerM
MFWFIPVVWVFISSIPVLIVWFSAAWSIPIILAIILLILIIHMIEAYYLNPRIVSNFLELPVSLTFVILFIWEHLFWIAGLLVWVSLFYFLTELFKDVDKAITSKHKVKKLEKKIIKRVKKSEA